MCVAKSQFQWLTSQLNNQSIYFNIKELKKLFKIRTCTIQIRHICAKEGGVTFVSSQYLVSRDLSKRVYLEEAGFLILYVDNHYPFSFTLLEQYIVGGVSVP